MASRPFLFTPISLRGVTLKNRVVISPMCQYSAIEGLASDWHFAHLAKFALGGAALVFTEAAAVEANGRITHGDLGIWSDAHIAPLKRITDFIKSQDTVPAMQLAHAGPQGVDTAPLGRQRADQRNRSRARRRRVASGRTEPDSDGQRLAHAARAHRERKFARCRIPGRRRHCARSQQGSKCSRCIPRTVISATSFSPRLSNKRTDQYGGDLKGRMRFTLELAEVLRAAWPQDKPLFVRVSSVDGIEGGWTLDDTVALAKELKARGVDVLDCSSGGLMGSATAARVKRSPGFQVPFAERVRNEAGIATMAVGLILDPHQAEQVLQSGQADLIAVGRQALYNPNWALHAEVALGVEGEYKSWPVQYGWWLDKRQHILTPEAKEKAIA